VGEKQPPSFMKFSVDATFQEEKEFGFAACIRDSKGYFISAISLCFQGFPTPQEAESYAVLSATNWISDLELTNIIIETL